MTCPNKCCEIHTSTYIKSDNKYKNKDKNKYNKNKGGVILYDPAVNKALMVQSRGNLWGFPKGTFEDGEDFKTCAQRELKEETGVSIDKELLTNGIYISSKVVYYYLEVNSEDYPVTVQTYEGNDANSIAWLNLSCLYEMCNLDIIKINYQAKKAIKKSFGININ